jgi:serine/threonine protein kinase/WD40 repeat protein
MAPKRNEASRHRANHVRDESRPGAGRTQYLDDAGAPLGYLPQSRHSVHGGVSRFKTRVNLKAMDGNCEKCGSRLASSGLGGLCPRCLMADGLGEEPPKASDTARFNNPFFIRAFGDYELLQEVARGGMGVIYKARQRSLGRIVAIKVLSSGEFASPEYVRRFRAEAEAAARLQHPNIVAIHEVGQHEGVRYFSMDYVEGPNLAQLQDGGTLPPRRAAAYLKTLAETIQYAHEQGILHRDLKPSNVLIDPFGEPRVTDFGLAKELTGESDLTVPGQVLGTPGYLPPEQADTSHGPLTPAADVYSLGAILYYMLTARAPFVSGSLRETIRQMMASEPVAPGSLNPEIPRDLETICLKCLERDPARRYPTAAALAEDLGRFLADEPIVARPISPVDRFGRWCRRRPTLAAAWALAMTLAIGSTIAAYSIHRAEAVGRERLREARLAEARAVRQNATPGRRAEALAALAEAAAIRPGADLRNEALSALIIPDATPAERWDLGSDVLVHAVFDPAGSNALVATGDASGLERDPPMLRRWGKAESLGAIKLDPDSRAIGSFRFNTAGTVFMVRCLDNSLRLWRAGESEPYVTLANRPLPGGLTLTQGFNDDYDFSPDGKLFALGLPGPGLSLHRVADGVEVGRREEGVVFSMIRFAPDGRHLAATRAVDTTNLDTMVFTLPRLALTNTITVRTGPNSMAWSSDGRVLGISAADNTITLFDVTERRTLKTLACPALGNAEFMFLGGDTMVGFRGLGSTLRLVNVWSGTEELVIQGLSPSEIAVAPGGRSLVATSLEGVATRWKMQPATGFQVIPTPRPVGYELGLNDCCLDFSPDGRWVVSSHGRSTLLRDMADGHLIAELDSGDTRTVELSFVAFCDDGRALLRYSTETGLSRIALDRDATGRPRFGPATSLDSEPGFMMMSHSPDGRRLALVNRRAGMVQFSQIEPGGAKKLACWHTEDAYSAALSPDGATALVNCAVTRANNTAARLRVHRVADGAVLRELPGLASCDTAWSADGRFAMSSNGKKRSTIWDTATWQPTAILEGPLGGEMSTFALAPNGDYAVINTDDAIYLVSTRKGEIWARLEIPAASSTCSGIRFLPDGRRFAVLWRDGRIDLIDPEALRAGLKPLHLEW